MITPGLMMMSEIAAVLQRYPPDCRPSQIEPLGSAGGLSGAQFWRITTPRTTLVLRRWPNEHPTSGRLRFSHAVLSHAAERGIPFLPVPIATREGQTFVEHGGHLWEITPWLPGTADYERSPDAEKLRAAMTALAQFHNATADFPIAGDLRVAGRTPAISRHLARLHKLPRDGFNELSGAITDSSWPELAPLARQFIDLLPRVVPSALAQLEPLAKFPLPLQPCIRDIWNDHVLFTGDEVTGIIDFGALDIDTPATDLARLLGSFVGDDAAGWQIGVAAYSAIRTLSPEESLAVFALDASGTILAGCNWIRWIYVENRQFEDHAQVVERFRRITHRTALD
ncbi:MAG: phosphotransferase [Pirellulales bacterium]